MPRFPSVVPGAHSRAPTDPAVKSPDNQPDAPAAPPSAALIGGSRNASTRMLPLRSGIVQLENHRPMAASQRSHELGSPPGGLGRRARRRPTGCACHAAARGAAPPKPECLHQARSRCAAGSLQLERHRPMAASQRSHEHGSPPAESDAERADDQPDAPAMPPPAALLRRKPECLHQNAPAPQRACFSLNAIARWRRHGAGANSARPKPPPSWSPDWDAAGQSPRPAGSRR